ncbi:MAG: S8 family serine peptidase [Pseudomonadales bacterium]|nr:S8 family serine peptidase [Pseudomonadales bacterium]
MTAQHSTGTGSIPCGTQKPGTQNVVTQRQSWVTRCKTLTLVSALSLLTACGGGGGGGDSSSGGDSGGDNGGDNGGTQISACADSVAVASLTASQDESSLSDSLSNAFLNRSNQGLVLPERSALANFSVSGSIVIPGGVMVDSDTADPANDVSNNSVANAQAILNPVSLAGYVSTRIGLHTDPDGFGVTSFPRDENDYYRVILKKSQNIALYSVDSVDNSAQSLCLLDSEGNETFTETSGSLVKTMVVPADGEYVIRVRARGVSALYQLVIGQATTARQSTLDPEADFIPNQVLVKFKDGTEQLPSGVIQDNPALDGVKVVGGAGDTGWLMDLSARTATLNSLPAGVQIATLSADEQKQQTLQAIAEIRALDTVEYAEPNYIREAFLEPNDRLFETQWHYPLINLTQAWTIAQASPMAAVRVAVIDTGIRSHIDLVGQVGDGWDFIGNDDDATDPGSSLSGASNFHGTHVTGTVVALTDNVVGVAGVAGVTDVSGTRPVKVMPLRVLDGNGSGSDADVIEAIKYASGVSNKSGRTLSESERAHVINMSLGGPGNSAALQEAIDIARSNDVVVIAAAGNENTSSRSFPAANDGVIAVGAVGPDRTRASYSNFGTSADMWVDIVAPGGELRKDLNGDGQPDGILSTWDSDNSYVLLQGTSMASPHVAGVVALMRAINPNLTGANIETLLASGEISTDLGTRGQDPVFGFGLIDAALAVGAASGQGIPAVLVVTPEQLNFGSAEEEISLRLSNGGTEALEIQSVTGDESWLRVEEVDVEANGLGEYKVIAERSGLAIGVYLASVTITLADGEERVLSVILQVPDPNAGIDAGRHYVLIIQASSSTSLDPEAQQDITDADSGAYQYSFPVVPEDSYYIIAGTDMDNDGFICDEGEFCAEYPVLNEPQEVIVEGGAVAGLTMTTNYRLGFGQTATGDNGKRKGYPRFLVEDNQLDEAR